MNLDIIQSARGKLGLRRSQARRLLAGGPSRGIEFLPDERHLHPQRVACLLALDQSGADHLAFGMDRRQSGFCLTDLSAQRR